MNPFVALCFLAAAAFGTPQNYGGGNMGSPSYGGGHHYKSQPPSSQSYSGPGHAYSSQPVAYQAPTITFTPPKITYSEPSITYSSPGNVPVALPHSYGSSGSSSSYNQQPVTMGYQPAGNNYGSKAGGYKKRRSVSGKKQN